MSSERPWCLVRTASLRRRPGRRRAVPPVLPVAVPRWGMRVRRFGTHVAADPRGRAMIAVPFDPDEAWGTKAEHLVAGTINGRRVRGTVAPGGGGWAFTVLAAGIKPRPRS
ncbi:MAG: DUF1905 domain-containing protein [Streptosporangiaceae bacterium]